MFCEEKDSWWSVRIGGCVAYGVHLVGNIESSNHSVLQISILIELHTDVKKED